MGKQKLKLSKEGRKYLDEIFDGIYLIENPTPLEISGLGKIVATSMVLLSVNDGNAEYYFKFKQNRTKGEIIKKGNNYYIKR